MLFRTTENLFTNGWFWLWLVVCAVLTAMFYAKVKTQFFKGGSMKEEHNKSSSPSSNEILMSNKR